MKNMSKAWAVARVVQRSVFLAALVGSLIVGVQSTAYALSIALDDGLGNSMTVEDNTDLGFVLFVGNVGSWFFNVTVGVSDPILGSSDSPQLDLSSLNVSGRAGTLTIMLTDTDFSGSGNSTNFLSSIGGVTQGTVTYQTYIDPGNQPFGMTTPLTDLGSYYGAFSGSASTDMTISGPYSLTLITTIIHTKPYTATSFNTTTTTMVSEPGSLMLLGSGLAALGLLAWRKKRPATPMDPVQAG